MPAVPVTRGAHFPLVICARGARYPHFTRALNFFYPQFTHTLPRAYLHGTRYPHPLLYLHPRVFVPSAPAARYYLLPSHPRNPLPVHTRPPRPPRPRYLTRTR